MKNIYVVMYEREAPLTPSVLSVHLTEQDAKDYRVNFLSGEARLYSYVRTVPYSELEEYLLDALHT